MFQLKKKAISPIEGKVVAVDSTGLLPMRPKLAELMPLAGLEASTKREIFAAYSGCNDVLDRVRSEAKQFMVNVLRANTTWTSDDRQHQRQLSETELTANFDSSTLSIAGDYGGAARAEIAALPIAKLSTTLIQNVVDGTTSLLTGMERELTRLVDFQQVGQIEWHSPDVVRYVYHRNEISDRTANTSTSQRTAGRTVTKTTTKDKVRHFRHSTITHDVIDAKENPLPARAVPRPAMVQTLIDQTPDWLKGMMSIVTGFQIAEERVDREAVVDRWQESSEEITELPPVRTERVRYDPALILGRYVLVGWGEDDIPKARIR